MNDFREKKNDESGMGPLKRVSVPEYTKMKDFAEKETSKGKCVSKKCPPTPILLFPL